MDRHTARLIAAGYRRLIRLADTAEQHAAPGVSLGMDVVTHTAPPELEGEYCRGCGQVDDCDCNWMFGPWCFDCRGPIAEDGSCGCWAPAEVEATDTEPDLDAITARIEAAGGQVLSLDEWARTSCPSLAAEAAAIRNATTPADL